MKGVILMKKRILILAAVLSLGCAANSFAAALAWLSLGTTGDPGGGTQVFTPTAPAPGISFRPSAGVVMGYAKQTNGPTYTLATYHMTGTFCYATTSVDTNIYRKENVAVGGNATQGNVTALAVPAAPADVNTNMGPTWVAGAWTASK
jgi:hypothetical protein